MTTVRRKIMGCKMGKKIFTVFLVLFTSAMCFAGQISVQIVQHNKALDYVCEESMIIEDELLNGCFDRGYIATNSLAQVSDSAEEDSELLYLGFGEAYDGGSDLFVQIKVYYDASTIKNEYDKTPCRLDHIDWVMVSCKSGETLHSSSVKGSKKFPSTEDSVREVSWTLISDIQKAL